ncbi:hypothetical protein [Desulfonatronum thiosulfatophilum]|uniref:hypothetical protein n=1 Tax=Desulfonatronum thiosulfatophilum TaxID=617002 RepID=UPI000B84008A|nr:hypothetical protein [Desulfonatronum thiosulfatophilum]
MQEKAFCIRQTKPFTVCRQFPAHGFNIDKKNIVAISTFFLPSFATRIKLLIQAVTPLGCVQWKNRRNRWELFLEKLEKLARKNDPGMRDEPIL